MSLILKAVEFDQRRQRMFIATIPVSALDFFSIDIWDPKNVSGRMGYQRQADEKRITAIAKYFERKSTIMPVAGLVNVREKNQMTFRNGELKIPDGVKVWVVDMQHRLKGLVKAYERGIIPRGFQFPLVVTEGLSQLDEATQFYIVNTKAKKMDVALTRRLLIENEQIKLLADVKPWEISAVRATIQLNLRIRGNPWYGVIRQPNEEKQRRHVATEKSLLIKYSTRRAYLNCNNPKVQFQN